MPTKALLLGTNHFDTEGEDKLQNALGRFAPSHILVEGSRESHEVGLAAKQAAFEVMDRYSVTDAVRELLTFERNGILRDISAVDLYGRSHPEVSVDFFRDEEAEDVEAVVSDMKRDIETALKQIQRMPAALQERLVRQQMDGMNQRFSEFKSHWNLLGNRSTEVNFAEVLRNGAGDHSKRTNERDKKKWAILEALRDRCPESRIVTVTGAAHILRTSQGVSLLDRIEASGKFEVTRDMLCFN